MLVEEVAQIGRHGAISPRTIGLGARFVERWTTAEGGGVTLWSSKMVATPYSRVALVNVGSRLAIVRVAAKLATQASWMRAKDRSLASSRSSRTLWCVARTL